MKKILKYIHIYTVIAGIACAFLRQDLLSKADQRGLLPIQHPANLLLWVLPILAILPLVFYYFKTPKADYRISIPLPIQAFGCLFAGAAYLYHFLTVNTENNILSLLTLATAVSFLVIAGYRVVAKKPPLLFFAVISLSMMVLCFFAYRQWGQQTQLQKYLFPALAALFPALYSLEFCYMELPERNSKKAYILNQLALIATLCCITTENFFFYFCIS